MNTASGTCRIIYIERSNTHTTESPTGQEKGVGTDRELEKMMTKSIPNRQNT